MDLFSLVIVVSVFAILFLVCLLPSRPYQPFEDKADELFEDTEVTHLKVMTEDVVLKDLRVGNPQKEAWVESPLCELAD